MKNLFFVLLILNFSCAAQTKWVDYEYKLKENTSIQYAFYNSFSYSKILQIKGGYINMDIEIEKNGVISKINKIYFLLKPKGIDLSKESKNKFIDLIIKNTSFDNPNNTKAKFGFTIPIRSIINQTQ